MQGERKVTKRQWSETKNEESFCSDSFAQALGHGGPSSPHPTHILFMLGWPPALLNVFQGRLDGIWYWTWRARPRIRQGSRPPILDKFSSLVVYSVA